MRCDRCGADVIFPDVHGPGKCDVTVVVETVPEAMSIGDIVKAFEIRRPSTTSSS
jgi:hypothetical protein